MTDFATDLNLGSFDYEFFKPADYGVGTVFLIEPHALRADVETKYGTKDYLDGLATSFVDGKADREEKVTIGQKGLVRPLRTAIGKAAPLVLEQAPTDKGNPAWVWKSPTKKELAAIKKYVDERDAAVAAETEDAPDFD